MKKWDIEVSQRMYDSLTKIFETLGMETPISISSDDMQRVLQNIETVMYDDQAKKRYRMLSQASKQSPMPISRSRKFSKAVVVSKLGIVRYQLKTLLQAVNVESTTFENAYNALVEYVKKLPDLIIIDISDNSDDLSDLVQEMKRISDKYSLENVIYILSLPTSTEVQNKYLSKGADKFIEKENNWHKELILDIKKINDSVDESVLPVKYDIDEILRKSQEQKSLSKQKTKHNKKPKKVLTLPVSPFAGK